MRYYDAAIGRYITRDPIGYADGLNVYLYVHGNPVNFFDPLGLGAQKAMRKAAKKADDVIGWIAEKLQKGKKTGKVTHKKVSPDFKQPLTRQEMQEAIDAGEDVIFKNRGDAEKMKPKGARRDPAHAPGGKAHLNPRGKGMGHIFWGLAGILLPRTADAVTSPEGSASERSKDDPLATDSVVEGLLTDLNPAVDAVESAQFAADVIEGVGEAAADAAIDYVSENLPEDESPVWESMDEYQRVERTVESVFVGDYAIDDL